jgi:hypothetical protein
VCVYKSLICQSVLRSFLFLKPLLYFLTYRTDELLHFSLPLLLYAAHAMAINSTQLRNSDSCWNHAYRRVFGFNTWESVKMFIWGLGRLDLCRLLLARRTNLYRHLLTVASISLHTLFQNFCKYFYHDDECIISLYN